MKIFDLLTILTFLLVFEKAMGVEIAQDNGISNDNRASSSSTPTVISNQPPLANGATEVEGQAAQIIKDVKERVSRSLKIEECKRNNKSSHEIIIETCQERIEEYKKAIEAIPEDSERLELIEQMNAEEITVKQCKDMNRSSRRMSDYLPYHHLPYHIISLNPKYRWSLENFCYQCGEPFSEENKKKFVEDNKRNSSINVPKPTSLVQPYVKVPHRDDQSFKKKEKGVQLLATVGALVITDVIYQILLKKPVDKLTHWFVIRALHYKPGTPPYKKWFGRIKGGIHFGVDLLGGFLGYKLASSYTQPLKDYTDKTISDNIFLMGEASQYPNANYYVNLMDPEDRQEYEEKLKQGIIYP